jgi:hypothetical protein
MQDLGFPSATAISSKNRSRSCPEYLCTLAHAKMRWSPGTMHMQDQNHMESYFLLLPFSRHVTECLGGQALHTLNFNLPQK